MKTLSLKLDDDIFESTESISSKLNVARNRYINDALRIYNNYNEKKMLKKQLQKESRIVAKNSMEVLAEFEKIANED
jgi:metal-responsive CopG/Arc/MetJ family transcriptional regulator